MKRLDRIAHLQKLSLADLQGEVKTLEQNIQTTRLQLAFGKSKQVRSLRVMKRDLARSLTIAHQAMQAERKEK